MSKKPKEVAVVSQSAGEFAGSAWFEKLVQKAKAAIEDYSAARTELVFLAKWKELQTRHLIGKLIDENASRVASADLLVQEVAGALGMSERLAQYCLKFYRTYPDIEKVPEGKSISWTRLVSVYLTEKSSVSPDGCPHKSFDIVQFRVCRKCGKREEVKQ